LEFLNNIAAWIIKNDQLMWNNSIDYLLFFYRIYAVDVAEAV
jgi:hypothetical protein